MDDKIYYGVVIWFSGKIKSYGFAEWECDGKKMPDIFIHYSDIQSEGYKILYKDQKISFQLGKNNHGAPKAINVKVIF